jgi:hypothetical protein
MLGTPIPTMRQALLASQVFLLVAVFFIMAPKLSIQGLRLAQHSQSPKRATYQRELW